MASHQGGLFCNIYNFLIIMITISAFISTPSKLILEAANCFDLIDCNKLAILYLYKWWYLTSRFSSGYETLYSQTLPTQAGRGRVGARLVSVGVGLEQRVGSSLPVSPTSVWNRLILLCDVICGGCLWG